MHSRGQLNAPQPYVPPDVYMPPRHLHPLLNFINHSGMNCRQHCPHRIFLLNYIKSKSSYNENRKFPSTFFPFYIFSLLHFFRSTFFLLHFFRRHFFRRHFRRTPYIVNWIFHCILNIKKYLVQQTKFELFIFG